MNNPNQQSLFRFQSWCRRSERAFSLHEALVTLAVVSTVTTFAVPSFQQFISSQRMTGAINSLITGLHLARSEAIKRGDDAVLCPSTDGRACINGGSGWQDGYLLYIDRNNNRDIDNDEPVIQIFGTTHGLRVINTSSHDHVRYKSNGMASFTNATFIVCDMHGRSVPKAVVISNSGRVRTATRLPGGGPIACPV